MGKTLRKKEDVEIGFYNLHVHSMFSLRDSIIRPNELVDRLQEIGQDMVAITDHGSSLGGVSIYKTLSKNNIKYIHGCEMYICDDVKIRDKSNKYYHLVLLCKNDIGRLNLNKLISISEHPDNFYSKPRIDFSILKKYKEGLICLSACMAGEISRFLEMNNNEGDMEAINRVKKYKQLFEDDYYLEIQSHSDHLQHKLNKRIISLAKETKTELVVTCDSHYVYPDDKKYQNKYAFNGTYKENGELYVDCYIQTESDVRRILSDYDEGILNSAINNTEIIAKQCNVIMPISAPIMPYLDTPKEFENTTEWLISLCIAGFQERLNIDYTNKCISNPDIWQMRNIYDEDGEYIKTEQYQFTQSEINEYIERYEYELNSICKMGFVDYILLVYSYANIAKRRGIARGSGGGSLINYLCNITNIDPLEHGLYFERFIDVGALDLLENGEITAKELKIPDIDLDFGSESCNDVLNWLYQKYGEDRVASIGKFGTNKTRGTIRDMCKVLGYSLRDEDFIAKSMGEYELSDIDMMISREIPTPNNAKEAVNNVVKHVELFDYVRKLNGLPKSFGLHACGKVISTRDLDDFLPSCYDSNGIRYLQGDMHDVEDVGLVKIDVLGLRTVDHEYNTLELIKEDENYIDSKQNFSDPKVLEIFKKGDTVGIFQMSSYGMKNTLKKMDIRGIEDLSIANALYRPGAMAYIDNFCKRRKGLESFEYLHPDLEPILKNTYGIIVFQEQLIEIGRLAKIRNPDKLRKATGKKLPKLLAEVKPELEEKLKNRGWNQKQFDTLWADMLEFSNYSFNKSHAAAYAIISFLTAKLKVYYPEAFYAGLINSYIGKSAFVKENAEEILSDMVAHKIKILPFNFRNDHRKCLSYEKSISIGIPLLKDCSVDLGESLFSIKNNSYPYFYTLLLDLIKIGVKKNQLSILIRLGFFDEFGNIRELLKILDLFVFFKQGTAKSISKSKLTDGRLKDIVVKYSTNKLKDGSEAKSYTITNMTTILQECESYIKSLNLPDLDLKLKIADQQEFLGYISVTGKEEDRPKLLVQNIYPIKRKNDGVQFGYIFVCQSLGSGIQNRFTVLNSIYKKCGEVKKNDIIYCLKYHTDNGYFRMDDYTQLI